MTKFSFKEYHVPERDLINATDTCPLCHSKKKRDVQFVIQENPEILWLKCSECKGSSSSMMPTDSFLKTYYRDYYKSSSKKITVGRYKKLAQHIFNNMSIQPKKIFKILDYGGGDGTVAKHLATIIHDVFDDCKVEIMLVDYNVEPNESTKQFSFESCESLSEVSKSEYDILLASAILEHIPDFHSVFSSLLEKLNTDGQLYARTPYSAPLKKIYRYYSLKFPMHVHDMGPSFWNRIPNRYPLGLLVSQPSLVASKFKGLDLIKSTIAFALKTPAKIEAVVRNKPVDYFWNLVGGWEVICKKK